MNCKYVDCYVKKNGHCIADMWNCQIAIQKRMSKSISRADLLAVLSDLADAGRIVPDIKNQLDDYADRVIEIVSDLLEG